MLRTTIALTLTLISAATAHAQQLHLKRQVPPVAWSGCPAVARTVAGEEHRERAQRLADEAAQAAILGDNARAIELLRGAAQVDPSSAAIAYQYGRALDHAGRAADAVAAYCRSVGLDPDSDDAEDVLLRISALVPADGLPEPAVAAFRAGLTAFEQRRLAEAEAAFSRALQAAPAWPDATYNRGAIRVALGRLPEASTDLRHYLELSPGATDLEEVLDVIAALRPVAPRSASGTLAAGLLVPGLGQFTTNRPATGLLVLGAAAGAAAAGFLVEREEVDCLAIPVAGACPADQVLRTRTERPYLVAGLAGAAAIGIAGAIEAWQHVRRAQHRPAAAPVRVSASPAAPTRAPVLAGPELHIARDGARLDLIRLRF